VSDSFDVVPVADRVVQITVVGKLRGSRARHLGEDLVGLVDDGVHRLVLDLRDTASLDSLGTLALEGALERGLRIHLVVKRSFTFDGYFASRSLQRRGLRIHHDLDDALRTVRDIAGSGLVLA
jgi:hypothetical protein